ncbi:MAG: TraR/DksA C4-type zinc finger protein [Anaerolineales bacterium]|nr:TraR/DksA C4-type zinc finger protein [Anaerolineales bacterium]
MSNLQTLLEISSSRHTHLCPRQVLGARMGLAGAAALGLALPRKDKGLLIILETDGCFADGIEVATGCSVGHRTLRIEDYGKIAATFIAVKTERALRLAPRANVRERAWKYAPDEHRHYFAQLEGYQRMPVDELFTFQEVALTKPLREILSRPGLRVQCDLCGEEIINQREIYQDHQILCRGCATLAYYQPAPVAAEVWSSFLAVQA